MIDIGRCFRHGWGLYRLDLVPLAAAAAVAAVVVALAGLIVGAVFGGGVGVMSRGFFGFGLGVYLVWAILLVAVGLVAYAWLLGTVFDIMLRRIRGGRAADLADLQRVDHLAAFAPIFIVLGFVLWVGYALLIIPGLILTTIWIYVLPLVADRGMGAGEAMTRSRALAAQTGYITTFATWFAGAVVVLIVIGVLRAIPIFGVVLGLIAVPFFVGYVLSMYFQVRGEGGRVDAALGYAPSTVPPASGGASPPDPPSGVQ